MNAGAPHPPAWWKLAAVAALGGVSLYNALIQYGLSERFASQFADPYNVMAMQARVASIQDRVPLTERVGYFSDVPFGLPAAQGAFFAAQYALAPRILVKEGAAEAKRARYWLGVFSKEHNFAQIGAERGLVMERDLGGYLIFYSRPEPGR